MNKPWASALLTFGLVAAPSLAAGGSPLGQVKITRGLPPGTTPRQFTASVQAVELPDGLEVADHFTGGHLVYQVEVPAGLRIDARVGDGKLAVFPVDAMGREQVAGLSRNSVRGVNRREGSFENRGKQPETVYFVVAWETGLPLRDPFLKELVEMRSMGRFTPVFRRDEPGQGTFSTLSQRVATASVPAPAGRPFRITFTGSRLDASAAPAATAAAE
jgi:hypothetical protein